jgi:hypothetical protein
MLIQQERSEQGRHRSSYTATDADPSGSGIAGLGTHLSDWA